MSRNTLRRADHLEFAFWLVFAEGGEMRLHRAEPRLGRDERAMYLTAKLPLSLWSVPSLRASIDVNSEPPPAIDLNLVTDALRGATGLDFDLRIASVADDG